jgi:hypothetical protein
MANDFFGMSYEDVFKAADALAYRADKNSPARANSSQDFFKMVEEGFSHLEEETEFMSYLNVRRTV